MFCIAGTKTVFRAFHVVPDKLWVDWDTSSLLVIPFSMQPRILLALFAAKSDWWLIIVYQDPQNPFHGAAF